MNKNNPLWWSSLQTLVLVIIFAALCICLTSCGPAHQGVIVVNKQTGLDCPVILIHEDQHTLILKNSQPCSLKPLPYSDQPSSVPLSN